MTPTALDPDRIAENHDRSVFCWSKYGTEAGEPIASILARKEQERCANDGVFLWGIGNSIRPSLQALVRNNAHPVVRFSAMKSVSASIDVSPTHVAFWDAGIGLEGEAFDLPAGSVVTSRVTPGNARSHFALVCFSETTLEEGDVDEIVAGQLSNYLTGSRLGGSQVTSVVQEDRSRPARGTRYPRGFSAQLVFPYLVTLTVSSVLPTTEVPATSVFSHLLEMRRALFT